jgi:hypothetical protein
MVCPERIAPQSMLEERTQSDPPAIAGRNAIPAILLEMLEERRNLFGSEIVGGEAIDGNPAIVGEKLEEELEGVTVGRDGVAAGSSDLLQMLAEERLDNEEERVGCCHDGAEVVLSW